MDRDAENKVLSVPQVTTYVVSLGWIQLVQDQDSLLAQMLTFEPHTLSSHATIWSSLNDFIPYLLWLTLKWCQYVCMLDAKFGSRRFVDYPVQSSDLSIELTIDSMMCGMAQISFAYHVKSLNYM